jgi:cytochrome c-type biogenesis protein CcmH/NrfG
MVMFQKFYAFVRLRYAQKRYIQGKTEKAIQLLEKNVQKCPQYSFTYLYLAQYYLAQNNMSDALLNIGKALQLESTNPVFLLWQGIIFYEQCEYCKAKESFSLASSYDPKNILIYNYIALCELQQGNIEKFETILSKYGMFESQSFQIRLLMALTKKVFNISNKM